MVTNHLNCNLIELKLAANDAGTMEFSGYGAVFGNVDAYGDVIEQGAFSAYLSDVKTGAQQWPAMLTQHGGWAISANDLTPVGVWTDLAEDDIGLKVSGVFADTERGKEAYALLKMTPRPAISGLSIGYFAKEYAYGGKNDPYDRLIKRIDLVEVSLVTFPANDKARINSVKSMAEMTEIDFERALRELGLSQKDAQIVISHGFRQLSVARNSGSDELKQLAANIERNIKIFN